MEVTHGLKKLQRDGKEFRVGALFQLPKIEELPKSFSLGTPFIEYQGDTDFCSGYATCGASGFQEGVRLNGQWSFAVSKMISGDIDAFGQDLKTACKVHTQYGAVETKGEVDNPRDIKSYSPDLFTEALKHKKQTYLEVASFSDHFDTIKKFIWRFRDEKRAVVIGVEFGWPLTQVYMDTPVTGGGHAMYIIGWDMINFKDYLVVVNSYGEQAGQKGLHYFGRDVINTYVQDYGAFAFVDMPREDVQYALDNNFKVDAGNWLSKLFKALAAFLKDLITTPQLTIQEKIDVIQTVQDNLPKPVEAPIVHSTAWCGGTLEERKAMFALANKVCDEEGLFPSMKRELQATICGESGWNQWAENKNANGTGDFGIAQLNTATYLKDNNMTPQEALDNPEKCLHIMAKAFKAGRKGNWFGCYMGENDPNKNKRVDKKTWEDRLDSIPSDGPKKYTKIV